MNPRVQAFITIGAIGFLIQLGSLALLTMAVGWPYEPATAIAVELAVVHNFAWHERWTWRDRQTAHLGVRARRLLRFHATNGLASLVGSVDAVCSGSSGASR